MKPVLSPTGCKMQKTQWVAYARANHILRPDWLSKTSTQLRQNGLWTNHNAALTKLHIGYYLPYFKIYALRPLCVTSNILF